MRATVSLFLAALLGSDMWAASRVRTVWITVTVLVVSGSGASSATVLQQDSDAAQDRVLINAITYGQVEFLEQLLESGADPNVKDPGGRTLLMLAAWSGQLDLVKLLLAHGADLHAKLQNGTTVLMGAAFQGHAEVVRVLLDSGADVNATAELGMTAVRMAARAGHAGAVDVLVKHGAATTEAELYRVAIGDEFILPHAKNVDDRPTESGDVILGIDRNGDQFLDSGDGTLRRISKDSLQNHLSSIYGTRRNNQSSLLYLVADPNTEYSQFRNVVEIAREAGTRVLSVVVEREEEPISLSRAAMDVQLPPLPDQRPSGDQPVLLWDLAASGNQIVLQLLPAGSYAINREPAELSELDYRIHAVFDVRPAKLLFLQVAGNWPYQDVITAMDVARGAGVQVIGLVPIDVPQGLPEVDLEQRFDPRDFSGVGVEGGVLPGDSSTVFTDAVVDQVPELVSCPPLQYPEELQQAGIEGTVVLQFVVETAGNVEPETIEVLRSTEEAFEAPAKELISGCTFRPGLVRTVPVRVLVQLPLAFTLNRNPAL